MSELDAPQGRHGHRTALVTGATGAIGPELVRQLVRAGYRVRVLARTRPQPGLLPDAADVVEGDLDDARALRRAIRGTDSVFHLAALLHINDPAPALRERYRAINVDGTARLTTIAREEGVTRFVYFSTISVYGPSHPGREWDETSALNPDSWYAETKAEAEQAVLGMGTGVVLRLAAVYGPRLRGNYARMFGAIARGGFVRIGDGENRRTLVHDRDVARAAILAATHERALGRVYNVTDGRFHRLSDLVAVIAAAVGRPCPRLAVPVYPALCLAAIVEALARPARRTPPLTRSMVRKMIEDVAVRGERLRDELDFHPQVALLDGWREVVRAAAS